MVNRALFRTILTTIRNQKWRSRLMIISAVLIVLSIVLLSGLAERQETKIEELVRDTKINCVVTDSKGTNSENLMMFSFYVDMLMGYRHERGCYLDEVVTDVRALATQALTFPNEHELRRILSAESDPILADAHIQLNAEWDESVFLTAKDVCLVAEQVIPLCKELDGVMIITVSNGRNTKDLQVIGTVTGGGSKSIYVPFYYKWDDALSSAFMVTSCSFTILDNSKLEQAKNEIYTYFSIPSVSNGADAEPFGVLVQDQTYRESLEKLEASLEMLRVLLPLLAVLGGLISFLATYAMTRGRQKEFAVMRCLGMHRIQIFAIVLLEQFLLVLTGGTFGMCLGWAIASNLPSVVLLRSASAMVLFLLGTAVAAMNITRINVMKLMKVED